MSPHRMLPLALLLASCGARDTGGGDPDRGPIVIYPDEDGDTIIDLHEGKPDILDTDQSEVDTDEDGTPDWMDLDSDDDGIEDRLEAGDADPLTLPWDSDEDGVFDFRDTDADGNCIEDGDEGEGDRDGDGLLNFADLDDDGDEIDDLYEVGEDCSIPDSDDDGKPDYRDEDSDADGVADKYEAGTSAYERAPRDTDGDGVADYLDDDSDGDGRTDRQESGGATPDTEPRDTDGDGHYDFVDLDSDGDGLTDADEIGTYGTDAYDADSDGDGYSDGAELSAGTDPLDTGSVIEGLYVTVEERTSVEEVFEFELNIQMGDVAFLIDTTCSMGSTINGMKSEYSGIVSSLSAALPDAEYGVATFDDYAYGGYGSGSDRPFILRQQVTSDISAVQSALSSISLHNGGDGPESGMEALYQGLSGAGYDQNCNKSYDSSTDVRPFLSSSSDAFGGSGGQSWTSSSAGGGTVGGFGFRSYSLPILIYAIDNYLRDPENGYGSPGGCAFDAGHNDVVSAATSSGAYLIGIAVSSSLPVSQMNKLADATSSFADTDGDGAADDRLVFTWSGSSSSALRTTIVNAVQDLVGSVKFKEISLDIEGDDQGFVTEIDPPVHTLSGAVSGQVIDFTLTFRGAVPAAEEDQIFTLTLNVVGDGSILLDTQEIYVLVPGTSY